MRAHHAGRRDVDEHRQDQKVDWLAAVETLLGDVESWLGPAVVAGVLKTSRGEVEVTEQDAGSYAAPVLEITDGSLTVRPT